MRDLHHFSGKSESIVSLILKLIDKFGPLLSPTTDFQIGYFSGRQSTKYWLICQEDLDNMNWCVDKTKGTMTLWCDGKSAPESTLSGSKRKKKADFKTTTNRR